MSGRGRFITLGFLCVLLASPCDTLKATAAPEPSSARSLQVTAVFLFNFAQFVRWPPAAFSGPHSPIVIGVLGDDPVERYLDEVVRSESIGGRPLVARHFRRLEDVGPCHVLFVGRAAVDRISGLMRTVQGRSVLTVGETPDFLAQGGMIRLVFGEHRTRIRINLRAAEAARLTISSKLLRLAEIAGEGKERP
ncbi:MAG TPA: YfiR family protein [Opitutaceae bacterium]|nr:YfiR family protein [Opitutaceae bacterium]